MKTAEQHAEQRSVKAYVLLICVILGLLSTMGCNKQFDILPDLKVGNYYHVKNVLLIPTDGGYPDPNYPVRLDKLYIGVSGVPYASIWAKSISRNQVAQYPDGHGGVRDSVPIVNGNYYEWQIPQHELIR